MLLRTVSIRKNPHRYVHPPELCAWQSQRRFGSCGSSTSAGAELEPVSANYAASPRASVLLHSCLLYFFFLVAKTKSNQNKRPRQHLNNSQCSARRANNRVRGSWRWLNEEFSASGFTQGHEDQQIANRAEPLQAAEGRKCARGCSCAVPQPRQHPG